MFRSTQTTCYLSGLLVNVAESKIMQSSKLKIFAAILDQFLNFNDHNIIIITAICRSTHFHIRNIGQIRNLFSFDNDNEITLFWYYSETTLLHKV